MEKLFVYEVFCNKPVIQIMVRRFPTLLVQLVGSVRDAFLQFFVTYSEFYYRRLTGRHDFLLRF
jgi:hypothetical protein